MKGRVVILDEIDGRNAAALVVDGRLEQLAIDPDGDAPLPGAVYRAVAGRPVKGQGGIFVRLPGGRSGFLRQISGIAPGQRLLVQVTGPAEDGQGGAGNPPASVQEPFCHRDAKRTGAEHLAPHPR